MEKKIIYSEKEHFEIDIVNELISPTNNVNINEDNDSNNLIKTNHN